MPKLRYSCVLLLLLAAPCIAAPKYTVCTITINSDNEAKLFKKKLNPKDFDFIEIVPEQSKEGGGKDTNNWFQEACGKLKAENRTCDLVIISGHFGGTFFGSSGKRLSLETLEEMGCNNSCPGIMQSPKEIFLFGCNTLAGKEKDTRTPEEYRRVLHEEVDDNGNRIFTDSQIEEIVAFRYSDFGHSNGERMSRAFSQVPHLYGFDSVAPSGKNGEESITKYLNSIPDYAKHLKQIELETVVELFNTMADTLKNINQPKVFPNQEAKQAFKSTHFSQLEHQVAYCDGSLIKGETNENFCSLFNEKISIAERLLTLKKLLTGEDGTKYLALAKQFFERFPPEKYDETGKKVFLEITQNRTIKERFVTMLRALDKMPALQLNLIDLGERLSFLSNTEAEERRSNIVVGLINQGTVEAKDFICSKSNWPQISGENIQLSAIQNENSLRTIGCLFSPPSGMEKFNTQLIKNLDSKNNYIGIISAWLLGSSAGSSQEVQAALIKILEKSEDQEQYKQTRQMVTWNLHNSNVTSIDFLKRLIKYLNGSDFWVKRDLAFTFLYAKSNDPEIRAVLEKAQNDPDPIVQKIVRQALEAKEIPEAKIIDEGSIFTTSKGIVFKRVKNQTTGELGWQDEDTKKIWFDEVKNSINQYEAELFCEGKGQSLPAVADFIMAEKHGIREITNLRALYLWSGSVRPDNADYAFGFYGNNGGVDYGNRAFRLDFNAPRCVGR